MSETNEIQAVTFGLDNEIFAVPVVLVREILDYRETFRIPNGPDYLLGLTEMRGRGVPTVDLRLRLGLLRAEPTPSTRILVVDVPLNDRVLVMGLVVDRVLDVSSFRPDQIGEAPDIGLPWPSEYIAGVIKRAEGFGVLVDVGRIFSSDDARLLGSPIADAA